jgi:hypothetical protein
LLSGTSNLLVVNKSEDWSLLAEIETEEERIEEAEENEAKEEEEDKRRCLEWFPLLKRFLSSFWGFPECGCISKSRSPPLLVLSPVLESKCVSLPPLPVSISPLSGGAATDEAKEENVCGFPVDERKSAAAAVMLKGSAQSSAVRVPFTV